MEKKIFREDLYLKGSLERDKPILLGSKCKNCGKIYFPKRGVCSECFSKELEDAPLSRKGKLFAYTVAYAGPISDKVPYAFGYVELPEGVKIFSLLTENNPDKLEVDMEMDLTTGDIKDPVEEELKTVYMFKPRGS